MRSPEEFDAFYAARDRLLLETYALTGDLPAARTAVRDAFAVAWHHWRKVSRLEDPEAWLRPLACGRAQRRHTARPWHREKGLDDDVRATLEALCQAQRPERKALVLTTLSPLSAGRDRPRGRAPAGRGRAGAAERHAAFATPARTASTEIRAHLEAVRPARRHALAARHHRAPHGHRAATYPPSPAPGPPSPRSSSPARSSPRAAQRRAPSTGARPARRDVREGAEEPPTLDAARLLATTSCSASVADSLDRGGPRTTWR